MKTVKGMRDWYGDELLLRDKLMHSMATIFKNRGAIQLDTPVAELKSTLSSRYGEEEKLIFDLADQGGEISCLRYDLTVPLIRYIDSHNLRGLKRYQFGKVYRRDQPNIKQGRLREFMQADFDVVGDYPLMVAEAEVIEAMISSLIKCNLKNFRVVVNDRRLLNIILTKNRVPMEKIKTVCSSIDKLDKQPWEVVAKELIFKGIDSDQLASINEDICQRGDFPQMLPVIEEYNPDLYREYSKLYDNLYVVGFLDKIEIDFSLARGLDYYEGIVFEVKKLGITSSFAAGGRYNASFRGNLPAVGFSIGIDRMMQARGDDPTCNQDLRVGVVTAGEILHRDVLRLCKMLWDADICCTYQMKNSSSTTKQLQRYVKDDYNFVVILGEEELGCQQVVLKNLRTREENLIPIDDVVRFIRP